jgi:hypothetical protein
MLTSALSNENCCTQHVCVTVQLFGAPFAVDPKFCHASTLRHGWRGQLEMVELFGAAVRDVEERILVDGHTASQTDVKIIQEKA